AGVVLAGVFRPPAIAAVACGAIALVVAMWRRALVVLLVAALAFGFTLAGLRLDSIRRAALAAGAARNADALLTGEVLTTPELGPSGARLDPARARRGRRAPSQTVTRSLRESNFAWPIPETFIKSSMLRNGPCCWR
ncbi:MAG: hypothetical protein ACXVES_10180, partial [Actinomycetota bacterium]